MSDPNGEQLAGAEIVRRCGNCHWRVDGVLFGVRVKPGLCLNIESDAYRERVSDDHTCDHWRKRGAE